MSKTEFHFEFHSQIPDVGEPHRTTIENELRQIATNQRDMIGASVAIEGEAQEEKAIPHLYRVRIVAYIRPENIVGVEKTETVPGAVQGALEAVRRQIQQRREKFRKPWEQTDKVVRTENIFELTAQEIYDTYVDHLDNQAIQELNRDNVASTLMVKEDMEPEAAYYAADQILTFA